VYNDWKRIFRCWESATKDAGAPITDECLFTHAPTTRECTGLDIFWVRPDKSLRWSVFGSPQLRGPQETAYGLLQVLGNPEMTARIWLAAFVFGMESSRGRHRRGKIMLQGEAIDAIHDSVTKYVQWHHASTESLPKPSPAEFIWHLYENVGSGRLVLSGSSLALLCAPYRALILKRWRVRVVWPEWELEHWSRERWSTK